MPHELLILSFVTTWLISWCCLVALNFITSNVGLFCFVYVWKLAVSKKKLLQSDELKEERKHYD